MLNTKVEIDKITENWYNNSSTQSYPIVVENPEYNQL